MSARTLEILHEGHTGHGILLERDAGYISTRDRINESLRGEGSDEIAIANPFFINAVLQKHSTKNKNGRVYPKDILEREAKRYQQLIDNGLASSEANHPDSSNIDVLNVAHLITKIWWEGNVLYGTLRFVTSRAFHETGAIYNAADEIVNLMRHGMTIGISSRGVGSVKRVNGEDVVQDDFEIICFDIVTTPSTPGSYLYQGSKPKITNESRDPFNGTLNRFLLG